MTDEASTTEISVVRGCDPRWYWNQQSGGDLSELANALVSSG